jgi:nucleotide-binding universal stress UspA family protein
VTNLMHKELMHKVGRIVPRTGSGSGSGKPVAVRGFRRLLLASEGRELFDAAIARAIELAEPGANVHVFSIARVYGCSFGLPNPGLVPTKREWEGQRELVAAAVRRLRREGFRATGQVLGTRKATRRICEAAGNEGCEAIVMGADPDRNRLIAGVMWSQEPQRVRRRAKVPVFLVVDGG